MCCTVCAFHPVITGYKCRVNEAQDLFDKGLGQLIKSLLKANNPLQKGNYYIFFDDNQAFPKFANLDAYIRTRDTLKEVYAYYLQFSNLRVNTGHGCIY